ncbi:hypothetical protein LINPERPRIM_LOCUS9919 [Linum perenne]
MEDFEKKVSLSDEMETEAETETLHVLRKFLQIQQRRALAYARLKRGFAEYMASKGELAYQQLCSEITTEFNNCSKQVLEIEALFLDPDYSRSDLAQLLRAVQTQEKLKLQLHLFYDLLAVCRRTDVLLSCPSNEKTATIQLLKKAGRPSERLVSHANCRFNKPMEHQCVHLHEITEDEGTEEAEANAEYDNALNEAIRGVQDAVTTINEHIEEVKYEIAAIETD